MAEVRGNKSGNKNGVKESRSTLKNNPVIENQAPEEASAQPHPIISVIGIFSDDPLWGEFIEEMAKARREQEQAYAEIE